MIQVPIILPVSSSSSSEQSYTQKCLEKPELSALYKKSLNQEDFSDEDVEELSKCVEDLKGSNATTSILILAGVLAFLVIMIIVAFALS